MKYRAAAVFVSVVLLALAASHARAQRTSGGSVGLPGLALPKPPELTSEILNEGVPKKESDAIFVLFGKFSKDVGLLDRYFRRVMDRPGMDTADDASRAALLASFPEPSQKILKGFQTLLATYGKPATTFDRMTKNADLAGAAAIAYDPMTTGLTTAEKWTLIGMMKKVSSIQAASLKKLIGLVKASPASEVDDATAMSAALAGLTSTERAAYASMEKAWTPAERKAVTRLLKLAERPARAEETGAKGTIARGTIGRKNGPGRFTATGN